MARELGGGYGDVTTRGNIQIREIAPKWIVEVLTRLAEVGLTSRGAGADNVRNITSSPLAGLDASELVDTRPLARAMQSYLTNNRDLFGLPRKFNIAFDGGGRVSVVADTNDIGFVATTLEGAGAMACSSVSGSAASRATSASPTIAASCSAPSNASPVAAAMLRVFAEHGDRTDRKKARLCYVLERLGVAKFLELVEAKLPFALRRVAAEACSARPPVDKHGHLGVHAQAQPGLASIGIAIPVGRMRHEQMLALAQLADDYRLRRAARHGLAEHRPAECSARSDVEAAVAAIAAIGFAASASSIAGCVVACTGNTGCRFAMSDTKGQALALQSASRPARSARPADQHPPDRLPAFLCAALRRRHRACSARRWRRATPRSRAITSTSVAASSRSAGWVASSPRACPSPTCRRSSSACSRATSIGAKPASRSSPSRAATTLAELRALAEVSDP